MLRQVSKPITVRVLQLLNIAVALIAVELVVRAGLIPKLFLSAPSEVVGSLIDLAWAQETQGHVASTLTVLLLSTLFAAIIGIAAGLVIGSIIYLRDAVTPYLIALFSLPKVILVPVFWSLFGFGVAYRLGFGTFHGVFPILLITIFALKGVDPQLLLVAKSLKASRVKLFRKVVLPSIMPSILAGIRLCFLLTFIGVLIAEMFVGDVGLGFLVRYYADLFQTTDLYAVIVLTVMISITANYSLLMLEKRITRWRHG